MPVEFSSGTRIHVIIYMLTIIIYFQNRKGLSDKPQPGLRREVETKTFEHQHKNLTSRAHIYHSTQLLQHTNLIQTALCKPCDYEQKVLCPGLDSGMDERMHMSMIAGRALRHMKQDRMESPAMQKA